MKKGIKSGRDNTRLLTAGAGEKLVWHGRTMLENVVAVSNELNFCFVEKKKHRVRGVSKHGEKVTRTL